MNTDRRMLNVDEVAEYTGLSKATLNSWRSRGNGPTWVKLGGAVRYPLAALDKWLEARTVQPVNAAI